MHTVWDRDESHSNVLNEAAHLKKCIASSSPVLDCSVLGYEMLVETVWRARQRMKSGGVRCDRDGGNEHSDANTR